MKNIIIDGRHLSYKLTKSRRKSLAIIIKPDGSLHVKAPNFVSGKQIEGYILKKSNWILKTLDRFSKQEAETDADFRKDKLFISGDILSFMGKDYTLTVNNSDEKRSFVRINEIDSEIILKTGRINDFDYKRAILEAWFRVMAKEVINEKADYFSRLLSVTYNDIRIKEQKSLWGSCSSRGNLNFNWRIIMAPEDVIDYLVIHELCHRRFMNHSLDFWASVGSAMPDYKSKRKWLKDNSRMLKTLF